MSPSISVAACLAGQEAGELGTLPPAQPPLLRPAGHCVQWTLGLHLRREDIHKEEAASPPQHVHH